MSIRRILAFGWRVDQISMRVGGWVGAKKKEKVMFVVS